MQNIHSLLAPETELLASTRQADKFSSTEKKPPNKNVSLDAVLKEFEEWRVNKPHAGTPMPDEIWLKLFELAELYTKAKVRALFGINNKQFAKKHEELVGVPKQTKQPPISMPPSLCEVKITPKKSTYQPQPLPSGKTLVVEFCRADGRVMKIHTTQDSILTLMNAFLCGG